MNRSSFNAEKLLDLILDDCHGNTNAWWKAVEIVADYMPPFPRPDTKPTKCSIKCGESFLRDLGHGYFVWDIHYGEDSEFYTPEEALLALIRAPVSPYVLRRELWNKPKAEGENNRRAIR